MYIGKDLPDEYTGSEYTYGLKGTAAKAKANAAQGLGEMLEIAADGRFTPNRKAKHAVDAANGWYRYESRFALPVYGEDGEIERYNVFRVYMIIRHDLDRKKYLYDVINVKKKRATRLAVKKLLTRTVKNPLLSSRTIAQYRRKSQEEIERRK